MREPAEIDGLGHFTTPADRVADAVISAHMARITAAIRCAGGARVRAIALTGGFGRGEGGVERDAQGHCRPVNDYDVLVVPRSNALAGRLLLRRRLKPLEPALTRELGLRVDIACRTPAMLANNGGAVERYEIAGGHKLLWGDGCALHAVPVDAAMLPACEATRYLFNRGAALLWAQRMLDQNAAPAEACRRFVLVAILKAWLAWGDALLLLAGRYDLRYAERAGRLAGVPLSDDLDFVTAAYRAGLAFKLRPDFDIYRGADLPVLLAETVSRHESVWRHVDTVRGTAAGAGRSFWRSFYACPRPLLRPTGGKLAYAAILYHLALNLLRVRPRTLRLLTEQPEERLVRALPALLFDADALTWSGLPGLLGAGRRERVDAGRLADRFIAIWHPGNPF